MNCERARQFLDAFAAGELDASLRQNVEKHVERCAACRKELAVMRRTISLLTEFHELDPPADFVLQLRERIESRRRSPMLERFLPRPASARALAAATCVLLAGLSVWLTVRQFLPRERVEEHERGGEMRGERLAFVPDTDDEFRLDEGEKPDLEDLKAGKESDRLDRIQAGEGAIYTDIYHGQQEKAPGAEGRPRELPGGVPAKGAPSTATSSPAAPISSEELPPVRQQVELAKRNAVRGYATQGRETAKETSEVEDTVTLKALPETSGIRLGALSADSEPREKLKTEEAVPTNRLALDTRGAEEKRTSGIERQLEEESRELSGAQLEERETVSAEGALLEAKPSIAQERLESLAGGGLHVAKLREQAGGDTPTTRKDADRDRISLGDVEAREREESTTPGAAYGLQRTPLDEGDTDTLFNDYAYTALYSDGAAQGTEATTGLPKVETTNGAVENGLLIGSVDLAGYDTAGTGMPALVKYVHDREKARAEIQEIVAEFEGSVHSLAANAENLGRAFGEAAVETLIVKLQPGTYDTFLRKLGGEALQRHVKYRGAPVSGLRMAEPTAEPATSARAPGKDLRVTLAIFLVEIQEQKKPDQPSQEQSPPGS